MAVTGLITGLGFTITKLMVLTGYCSKSTGSMKGFANGCSISSCNTFLASVDHAWIKSIVSRHVKATRLSKGVTVNVNKIDHNRKVFQQLQQDITAHGKGDRRKRSMPALTEIKLRTYTLNTKYQSHKLEHRFQVQARSLLLISCRL